MKIYYKTHLAVTLFSYLCVSFVKWNMLWLFEIPNYDMEARFAYLFFFVFIHGVTYVIKNFDKL